MRGAIEHQACLLHERLDNLVHRARVLANGPAALPVAFACGILVERMGVPGIRTTYEFLASLAGEVKTRQIVSSLIGPSIH